MTPPALSLNQTVADKVNADRSAADHSGEFNSKEWETPIRRRGVRSRNGSASTEQAVDSSLPIQESRVEAFPRAPKLKLRHAEQRVRALQQWEGTVLEITQDEFIARTHDLTNPAYADEQVTLPLDDVPPADRELLTIGAVFYWTIGYEENDEGSRKRTSVIRFRRLPGWSERAVQRIDATANELMRLFGLE